MLKPSSLLKSLMAVILLIACGLSLSAADKGITINVSNATLAEVFRMIENQSDYRISYRTQLLDDRPVTLHKTDASVDNILNAELFFD